MNSNRGWFAALAVAPILFFGGAAHADDSLVVPHRTHRPMCDPLQTKPGHARCFAHANTNPDGSVIVNAAPKGYGPPDLVSAYSIPSTGPGSGLTVGIVDSNDSPDVESDLATYRTQYGLPACTTANGCFKKVNQNGTASPLPAADTGWAGEIALDVDMVSAICPSCKILLVETDSSSQDDLGAGLLAAIKLGAAAVSNSYGGDEDSSVTDDDTQYFLNHDGILITVSAGDNGYGAQYPATSAGVLAIGGTSLTKSTTVSRGWLEKVWTDSGSGCSKYIKTPSWQTGIPSGCAHRMEADISASADNEEPVAVYCSATDCGSSESGWQEVGGTSEASPIVASLFTLLGLAGQSNIQQWVYQNTSKFYDITSGSNGTCTTSFFCKAATGFDGPTGWGSPNAPELLQTGGTTPPVVDAGAPSSGKDAGSGTPPVTGSDAGSGTGTGGGGGTGDDDSGTTTGGGGGGSSGDDDGSNEDAGTVVPPYGSGDDDDDSGVDAGASTSTVDAGAGSGFSGSSGGSNGCSCDMPGSSSPMSGGGASVLALGAVAVFASRRRRRG